MGYNVDGARTLLEAGSPIPETLVVGPGTDEPPGRRPRPATCRWTRACAGWSTSPRPRRSGWASASRCRGAAPRPSRRCWCSASRRRSRPTPPRRGWRRCSTPITTRAGLRSPRPGTPTNNTAEGELRLHRLDSGGFNVEVAPPGSATARTAAEVARRCSASAATLFTFAAGAARLEDANARQLHALLWAATGGRFLEQMMVTGLDARPTLDAARRFFIDCRALAGPAADAARRPPAVRAAARDVARLGDARGPLRRACCSSCGRLAALAGERAAPAARADDELRLLEILRHAAARRRPSRAAGVRTDTLSRPRRPSGLPSDLSRTRQFVPRRCAIPTPSSSRPPRGCPTPAGGQHAADRDGVDGADAGSRARLPAHGDLRRPARRDASRPAGRRARCSYALARHSVLLTQASVGRAHPHPPRSAAGRAAAASRCSSTSSATAAPEHTRTLARLLELDPALRTSIHTLTAAAGARGGGAG